MENRITKPSMAVTLGLIISLSVAFAGCAARPTGSPESPTAGTETVPGEAKRIQEIEAMPTAEGTDVIIRGAQLLTYTALKQPYPPAITLYFPDTTFEAPEEKIEVAGTLVSDITTETYDGDAPKTKIQIHLSHDTPYEITRDNMNLRVSIATQPGTAQPAEGDTGKAAPPAAASSESQSMASSSDTIRPARRFDSLTSQKDVNGVVIRLKADGQITDTESFTLSNPARVVFDLPGIESPSDQEEIVAVNSRWIKRIRYYADGQKLRLVLDSEDQYLASFQAVPQPDGLAIYAGSVDQLTGGMIAAGSDSMGESAAARVEALEFISKAEGRSAISLRTNREIDYTVVKADERQILLQLPATTISNRYLRPLITTHFESAVDRITPLQPEEAGKSAMLQIDLREAVPYHVEASANEIVVNFEASAVPPEELDTTQLAQAAETPADMVQDESPAQTASAAGALPSGGKGYSGEKIALDFFETDIKNVFRILREISGKNFAIDQDVTGKVTLTLDKPVPWDQVLDLVLKMNQLGMKDEGDIIRIGTLETFRKEEELVQARLEAENKTKEQQKTLEPLMTEYLAVNYSNAKADILPHLAGMVTPERGSISVNERTNQIILTDTAETIEKAKDVVRQLDKVTPQVLIEARIVEATTNFSRELGVLWAMQSGWTREGLDTPAGNISRVPTDNPEFGTAAGVSGIGPIRGYDLIGGTYVWDTAVNLPIPSEPAGSFNFNFLRLEGTPFVLNATLEALESQAKGKIISSPKILTLDNKTAMIKQGIRYPYNKLDESGNTVTEFEDIDLILEVTPHVTLDDRVLMNISITKKDLGLVILGNQSFTNKEAQTELLVDDGDTIVIGGIIKSTGFESEKGIPWLRKIPIFGWLFQMTENDDDREELLIFITPKIVKLEQNI